MAMRNQSDISLSHRRKHSREHARRACGNLFHRLTWCPPTNHAVRKRAPVVAELASNVARRTPLVSAVIPLDEKRIDLGMQACQFSSSLRAL